MDIMAVINVLIFVGLIFGGACLWKKGADGADAWGFILFLLGIVDGILILMTGL